MLRSGPLTSKRYTSSMHRPTSERNWVPLPRLQPDIIDSISQSDKPLSEEDSQQDKNQLIEDILRRLVQ